MATRGIVIWVGGQRPWISRFGDGTSPSNGEPFETLRAAQLPIEASVNQPVKWRRLDNPDGTVVAPETWVAEAPATSAYVVGGAGPFAVADGDQFSVFIDGSLVASTGTIVVGAAQAVAQVAGNYTLAAGSMAASVVTPSGTTTTNITLVGVPTVAQNAAAAAAFLNANATFSVPGIVQFADDGANSLVLESVATGTGVQVIVNGATALANSIGFTAATTSAYGTGNFPVANAATAAEVAAWITSNISGVTATATAQGLTMYRNQAGLAYSLQVSPTSGINFGFDFLVHYGTG